MEDREQVTERNRKNALASTGPKTELGKVSSSSNALTHGLRSQKAVVPGESLQEWQAFETAVASDIHATTETERALANHIASALWRLNRGARFEAEVTAKNLNETELKAAYEAYLETLPYDVKIRSVHSLHLDAAKKLHDEAAEYLQWYRETFEFYEALPTLDPKTEIIMDFPEELGQMIDAPEHAVQTILLRDSRATVQDILDLLSIGKMGLSEVKELLKIRLDAKEAQVAKYAQKMEKTKALFNRALARFAANQVIPKAEDVTRIQTYEAHLFRNLQRSLESLKLLREVTAAPPDIKVRGKVASIVKKD